MGSEPNFQVEVRRGEDGFLVTPKGELDIATVDDVRRALADRKPGEALVLDLGQLTFMDTSGLQLVVEAQRTACADGFALSVRRGPPSIQRVFEISGLDDVLPFADGTPMAADSSQRTELSRNADAPAQARSTVGRWLSGALDPLGLADVKLLVSELVTNAVRHPRGAGRIVLEVAIADGHVRVEVSDPGSGFTKPKVGAPPPDALGGRGLLIVDRVASRWGVTADRQTRVWFELDR